MRTNTHMPGIGVIVQEGDSSVAFPIAAGKAADGFSSFLALERAQKAKIRGAIVGNVTGVIWVHAKWVGCCNLSLMMGVNAR